MTSVWHHAVMIEIRSGDCTMFLATVCICCVYGTTWSCCKPRKTQSHMHADISVRCSLFMCVYECVSRRVTQLDMTTLVIICVVILPDACVRACAFVCVFDGTCMPLCGCSYALSMGSRCHTQNRLAATPVRCVAQRRNRTSAWCLVFLVIRGVPSCTRGGGGWPADRQPFAWVGRIPP